jgi:hypothetical protein
LKGLIIDNKQAELTGDWSVSSTTQGYVGDNYIHDENVKKGDKSVKFTATIENAGKYDVRMSYSALANRASNVPVTVTGGGESKTIIVNQKKAPKENGFASLGKFVFKPGDKVTVTVSNKDTDGHVIVDAVQFVAD